MKILVVTNSYPRSGGTSSGMHVKSQLESLKNLGIKFDMLYMDTRANKLEYLKGIWKVHDAVKKNYYQLIHVYNGLAGISVCLQRTLPIVVSFTGGDVMNPKTLPVSRFVAKRAAEIIVKSKRMFSTLAIPKAHVIPNGVNLKLFTPVEPHKAKEILNLNHNKKYILFVGDKNGSVKRFELVMQAVESIKTIYRERPIELLSVFNEPIEKVVLYINASDVLILTSEWEGSPNVIKEAMACNLPIVSVDVGDVGEIIGNTKNCFICSRKTGELSNALLRVLKSGERSGGRKKILHLSEEIIACRIEDVYQKAISRD